MDLSTTSLLLDKSVNQVSVLNAFVRLLVECPEVEAAMDVSSAEPLDSEVLYDCVICGQSGPSTDDRPTGLVVLLQASSGEQTHHTCIAYVLCFLTFLTSCSFWCQISAPLLNLICRITGSCQQVKHFIGSL